jgi:hypothetical protein
VQDAIHSGNGNALGTRAVALRHARLEAEIAASLQISALSSEQLHETRPPDTPIWTMEGSLACARSASRCFCQPMVASPRQLDHTRPPDGPLLPTARLSSRDSRARDLRLTSTIPSFRAEYAG